VPPLQATFESSVTPQASSSPAHLFPIQWLTVFR
jgi:hypothetical protein